MQCYQEPNCVSYNFKKMEENNGQHKCDLNDVTYDHNEHSSDFERNLDFVYRGAEVNVKGYTYLSGTFSI